MASVVCLMLTLIVSCTIKQENKVLDIISPSTFLGTETVYELDGFWNIEEVYSSQKFYLDGDEEEIYTEIDDQRYCFSELSSPIILSNGVVVRFRSADFYVERLPQK